jgi:enoyl-CoA hydratase
VAVTSSIRVEPYGEVAVLHLEHGKANTLDTEFCRAITWAMEEVLDPRYVAVVLTGTGDIFSAGADLRRILAGGRGYIANFLPALSDAFLAVFGFPRPVVAAVNGHAIAGGAVLAAACDRRVMGDGQGRIGVTELLVGVPFPLVAMEILRCTLGNNRLSELAFLGRTYPHDQALMLGLVDEVTRQQEVLPRAVGLAKRLAAIPTGSFAHTKAQIHHPFHERIAEYRAGDDTRMDELWSSPEALASIKSYVDNVLDERDAH